MSITIRANNVESPAISCFFQDWQFVVSHSRSRLARTRIIKTTSVCSFVFGKAILICFSLEHDLKYGRR